MGAVIGPPLVQHIFRVIRFDDMLPAKRREVCHTSVVCEIRADKDGGVATRTRGLELVKLMMRDHLRRLDSKEICGDRFGVGLVHTYSFPKMTFSQDGMAQC